MVARFWRARLEHGKDAGSRNSSAIPATEDAARRRPAAAKTGHSLVDGALAQAAGQAEREQVLGVGPPLDHLEAGLGVDPGKPLAGELGRDLGAHLLA